MSEEQAAGPSEKTKSLRVSWARKETQEHVSGWTCLPIRKEGVLFIKAADIL